MKIYLVEDSKASNGECYGVVVVAEDESQAINMVNQQEFRLDEKEKGSLEIKEITLEKSDIILSAYNCC